MTSSIASGTQAVAQEDGGSSGRLPYERAETISSRPLATIIWSETRNWVGLAEALE
jgi:hypothetical protein